jgi:ferric-dicitrate binding protein FerR (iron transport regulator)
MNSCNPVRELLPAYIDHELTDEQRGPVESHLSGCSDCRAEVEALRKDERLLRSTIGSRLTVGNRINEGVWAAIEAEDRAKAAAQPARPATPARSGGFRVRFPSLARTWGFAGGMAALAILLMAVFLRHPALGPMDTQIASLTGTPLWKSADGAEWLPLKIGMVLHSGDSVKTDAGAKVTSEWKDGTRALLGPGGEGSVLHMFPGIELKQGRITAKVTKRQSKEMPFTVRTAQATAQVMGTKFRVDAQPSQQKTAVEVLEGAVYLFNPKGSVTVREWSRSEVAQGQAPTTPQGISPLKKSLWDL